MAQSYRPAQPLPNLNRIDQLWTAYISLEYGPRGEKPHRMTHIFISYSSKDRARAAAVAHALEDDGHDVWWDRDLLGGQSFDRVIHQALTDAQVVIVLWSENSIKSDWVKDEASLGKQRQCLLPVLIDDVNIPLGFGRIHSERLIDWDGDKDDPQYRDLIEAVAAQKTGDPPPAPTRRPRRKKRRLWVYGAIAGVLILIAAVYSQGIYGAFTRDYCDAPGFPKSPGQVAYRVQIQTADRTIAGTDSDIYLSIKGAEGTTERQHLNPWVPIFLSFEKGADDCLSYWASDVGAPVSVMIDSVKDGLHDFSPDWFPEFIAIQKDDVWYTSGINREIKPGKGITVTLARDDDYVDFRREISRGSGGRTRARRFFRA